MGVGVALEVGGLGCIRFIRGRCSRGTVFGLANQEASRVSSIPAFGHRSFVPRLLAERGAAPLEMEEVTLEGIAMGHA